MRQSPERTWVIWLTPIVMAVLTGISLIMPPLLLICILMAVYYDSRLGGWTQTIVMGAVLALMGIWLWGVGGVCLLLLALIPTLTAIIALRQKVSFGEGLIYAFVAGLFSLVAAVFVLFIAYQQDPLSLVINLLKETIRTQGQGSALAVSAIQTQAMVEWSAAMSSDLNGYMKLVEELSALSIDDLLARVMPTYESFIRLYAPTVMVGYTMLAGLCSWIVPGFALKKRIRKNNPVSHNKIVASSLPPAFIRWSISRGILLICTLVLAITLFIPTGGNTVVLSSMNALSFAAEVVILVQGVSFAAYWLRSKKVRVWLCWLIILAAMALFYTLFVMLGLADGTMQLRRMMIMRKHSAKMQELVTKYKEDPRELDRNMREFMEKIEEMEEEEDFSAPTAPAPREDHDPEEENSESDHQDKD